MPDKRPEDLSVDELRQLLLQKRRTSRNERLEHFRRTGRALSVTLDVNEPDDSPPIQVIDTPEGSQHQPSQPTQARGNWLNRLLLSVEILAILGLVAIIISGLGILRTLNQEVAETIQQPTIAPTPLITAVVLPSGHTPPTSPEGAQPNFSEIPEHLRPLAQTIANVPIPTPGVQQAVRIQIPAIGVDAPIVQGDGWEQLKKGVGQHIGTGNPGENGNMVLSAHNDIFGEIFRELDQLKPGDVIIVYTNQRQFTYIITGTQVVEPTRVEVMAPTSNPTITLVSCYPYLVDTERIIVSAVLQNP